MFAWGKNCDGQLGVGDTEDKCQPTQLATLRSLGVKYIATGFNHTAFLTEVSCITEFRTVTVSSSLNPDCNSISYFIYRMVVYSQLGTEVSGNLAMELL